MLRKVAGCEKACVQTEESCENFQRQIESELNAIISNLFHRYIKPATSSFLTYSSLLSTPTIIVPSLQKNPVFIQITTNQRPRFPSRR